jgi:hypothetical protein
VGSPRTGVGRDPRDGVPVELHGKAWCQVVRDEDGVGSLCHVDRIMVGQPEQNSQHADVHVGEIADALAYHRLRVAREVLSPLDQDEIERFLSPDVLPDEGLDTFDQLLIVEDCDLHFEDRCLLFPGVALGALFYPVQPLASIVEGRV